MFFFLISFLRQLVMKITLFHVKLRVIIIIFLSLFIFLILTITICKILHRRRKSHCPLQKLISPKNPKTSLPPSFSLNRKLLSLSNNISELQIHELKLPENGVCSSQGSILTLSESTGAYLTVIRDSWRGGAFSFREIEAATNGLAKENVIGSGDCGVSYHGCLLDNTRVSVKRLPSNGCKEKNFIAEMEAIGHVRHKNVVKMLGFCVEGPYRMLVYEYIDNGNLYQWLHEFKGQFSPLTWRIRMDIVRGIAKGLAYLHEDVDEQILHRNLKSSNILLDRHWNPKLTHFGLTKLISPHWGHLIMETLGYEDPGYNCSAPITSKTDVYSFGILIMEIVTGRRPLDHNQEQPHLIEWLKAMISSQKAAFVVDPKLRELPISKDLKRLLLIALRCVDPDLDHQPRMADVIHLFDHHVLLSI